MSFVSAESRMKQLGRSVLFEPLPFFVLRVFDKSQCFCRSQ